MNLTALIVACALHVAPSTMHRLVMVESGGNPLSINVNGLAHQPPAPTTKGEAVALAQHWIAAGHTVDIGYAQINNLNLPRLHYTIEDALDPCRNLAGGAAILDANYNAAVRLYGPGENALRAALMAYHTGRLVGRDDAYLARYFPAWAAPTSPASQALAPALNPYSSDTEVKDWNG